LWERFAETGFSAKPLTGCVVSIQVSGRQARRAAFREAQHTDQYVSIHEIAAQRRITA
jgi:hypothetical protein